MSLSFYSVPGTLLSTLREWASLILRWARWLCYIEQIMKRYTYNPLGKHGMDNSFYITVFYEAELL